MKAPKTIEQCLFSLTQVLTAHDRKESTKEAKRGHVNIYRLGLLFKAQDDMVEKLPAGFRASSSLEARRALAAAIRVAFTLRCTDKLADEIERD